MATSVVPRNSSGVPIHHSVGTRVSAVMILLILVTTVAMSVINYVGIRDSILNEVHLQLKLQNESMREILLTDIDLLYARVDAISNRSVITDTVKGVLAGNITVNLLQDRLVATLKNIRRTYPNVEVIGVATLDGEVIASTNLAVIGERLELDLLEMGRLDHHISLLRLIEEPKIVHASAPILSNEDELLGVIAVDVRSDFLNRLSQLIKTEHESSRVRLGRRAPTGEFEYLFTTHTEDVGLMSLGSDDPMDFATQGKSGYLDSILDHRQVEVVTAYDPLVIENTPWGLVSQVDVPEIYEPLRDALWVVLFTAVVCSLLAVVLAIYAVKSTLTPIFRLVEATGRLKQEDDQLDIEAESKDEIGVLGRAFNNILKERSGYTRRLRQEVTERTEALEKSNIGLQSILQRVESQNDLMEQDLRRAEIFQKSLLPKQIPEMKGFAVGALYLPGTAVGGDLYDVIKVNDDEVAFLIADSAGHGAGAAMLSVLFKLRLEATPSSLFSTPAQVFNQVNDELAEDFAAPGVFVTGLLLVLDRKTRSVKLASAGHPPMLVVRKSGEVTSVERTGPALGLSKGATFSERHLPLIPGDRLLLYTDGLFDVGEEEAPDLNSIAEILRSKDSSGQVLDRVYSLGSGSVELPDRDDVTLCLVDVNDDKNYVRVGSRRGANSGVTWNSDHNEAKSTVRYAETELTTFFFLTGRITWMYSEAFYDAATAVVSERRSLVIEFEKCEYLDSAMLGTLHEIVTQAESLEVGIKLQNVSATLRDMFSELGLGDVLNHIVLDAEIAPRNTKPLAMGGLFGNTRLIRAHDTLAGLNQANFEQFSDVVSNLREGYHNT